MCHINKEEMKIKQTASDNLSKVTVALLFLSMLTQGTHFSSPLAAKTTYCPNHVTSRETKFGPSAPSSPSSFVHSHFKHSYILLTRSAE